MTSFDIFYTVKNNLVTIYTNVTNCFRHTVNTLHNVKKLCSQEPEPAQGKQNSQSGSRLKTGRLRSPVRLNYQLAPLYALRERKNGATHS